MYAACPGVLIGNSDKALPYGINVRGAGGYIVASPSVHKGAVGMSGLTSALSLLYRRR